MTPADAGALDVVETALKAVGFETHRIVFSAPGTPDIDNLFAKIGEGAPHLAFAGHTDVVPAGRSRGWRFEPFAGGNFGRPLYGRGATDMKARSRRSSRRRSPMSSGVARMTPGRSR